MMGYQGRGLVVLMLLVSGLGLSQAGCTPLSQRKKLVDVAGEYDGLNNQRVAVMVAADGYMLSSYPQAPLRLTEAMSARIAQHVPGVTVTIPQEIVKFQEANPYWMNMRYGELVKKMGVDKIVLIDLVEYQTHEPGNAHVWQGLVTANIGVIDAHGQDPDNFAYYNTVSARFPEGSDIGIIDADDETIQLGMDLLFARKGAGLFYDHQVEVNK